MVISSNARKQIKWCDDCLDDIIEELKTFTTVFGKKKEIEELIREIIDLKSTYKGWERAEFIYPRPNMSILEESIQKE